MSHKNLALSFLKLAASGNVKEAYDRYISTNFIHHNQYFKGDRQSLLEAMEISSKTDPNDSIETIQTFEQGDTVITHSRVTRKDPSALAIAVVHIFRFEEKKVVELWDLGQEISKDSPNENGPF